jgi:hypothetical protein
MPVYVTYISSWFGISGCALSWVKSYLSNRSFYINLTGTKSSVFQLLYGVPQVSVLGPLLFILSTTPLSLSFLNPLLIIISMLMTPNSICLSLPLIFPPILLILKTLVSICDWMSANFLSLNPAKTEFLLIGQPRQLAKLDHPTISLADNVTLSPAISARNLGDIFDSKLSFTEHISAIPKSCLYHIRDFKRLRSTLTSRPPVFMTVLPWAPVPFGHDNFPASVHPVGDKTPRPKELKVPDACIETLPSGVSIKCTLSEVPPVMYPALCIFCAVVLTLVTDSRSFCRTFSFCSCRDSTVGVARPSSRESAQIHAFSNGDLDKVPVGSQVRGLSSSFERFLFTLLVAGSRSSDSQLLHIIYTIKLKYCGKKTLRNDELYLKLSTGPTLKHKGGTSA